MTTTPKLRKRIAVNAVAEKGHPRLVVPAGCKAKTVEVQEVADPTKDVADVYLVFEGDQSGEATREVNVSIVEEGDTTPPGQTFRGNFSAGAEQIKMAVYSD
jgi:hypothetical protein